MRTISLRTLSIAHNWVSQAVNEGDIVIDATTGNGHDTLFLAQLVGEQGRVIGFDLQEAAIQQTSNLLEDEGWLKGEDYLPRVSLHATCHSKIADHSPRGAAAIMFNLGYLPSGDKSVITQTETTLEALDSSLGLLKENGILTVVCYPGHSGGEQEAEAVQEWAKALYPTQYNVLKVEPLNPRSQAPYLIGIQKGR